MVLYLNFLSLIDVSWMYIVIWCMITILETIH